MPLTYDAVGVDTGNVESSLVTLGKWVNETFGFHAAAPLLPLGYFANVVPLSPEIGLAISTDGVGTKLLLAQEMGKYDTIGIDCVAMNANDILCVGARPVSMVDYIGVERADPAVLGEIAKGLRDGALAAGINIPAGEIAQVPEMVHGRKGAYGFDLVGTCIGTVHPKRLIVGQDISPGDAVVGLRSSGVHSNGFTLVRHALFGRGGLTAKSRLPELGRVLGDELIEPTAIYVRAVLAMLDAGLPIKAMIHVTGDGFLNLARVAAPTGFVIDRLPEEPPIFGVVQRFSEVDDAEMFRVFNMGIGFCVVVDPGAADQVLAIAAAHGHNGTTIGYAVADEERRIWIPERGLVGHGKTFQRLAGEPPARPATRGCLADHPSPVREE